MTTLPYELAKQLKDAGFPQGDNFEEVTMEGAKASLLESKRRAMDEYGKESVHYPTLSELISACGDKFGRIERTKMPSGIIVWNAFESYPHTLPISMSYSTPEIAVSKLWLAINQH